MSTDIIVVKQLPVIEERLRQLRGEIEERVNKALSLAVTEETVKAVKKVRADLNKEFGELESRRKEVKAAILAPYETFEKLYKECVADAYRQADSVLKERIYEVENDIRRQKQEKAEAYFAEYRESLGIAPDVVQFADMGLWIGLSDTDKSLRDRCKEFLDRVNDDLRLIASMEHAAEILVEYKKTHNASQAVTAVKERHAAIEAELRRQEEQKQVAVAEEQTVQRVENALRPPVVEDKKYTAEFRVVASMQKLKELKRFLEEGGYEYEQL